VTRYIAATFLFLALWSWMAGTHVAAPTNQPNMRDTLLLPTPPPPPPSDPHQPDRPEREWFF